MLGGATSQKSQNQMKKPWYLHYNSVARDGLDVKGISMIHLSSSNWFGPLFSSQNWTNSENIQKNSSFSLDFDDFCRFFECHSILAEKQQTKQTNYSFLSLSASLDTQDTLQGGMIVEWNTFWQEIPLCLGRRCCTKLVWISTQFKQLGPSVCIGEG